MADKALTVCSFVLLVTSRFSSSSNSSCYACIVALLSTLNMFAPTSFPYVLSTVLFLWPTICELCVSPTGSRAH